MEKEKKIKIIAAFVAFLIVAGVFIKMVLFPSKDDHLSEEQQFLIATPDISEEEIESVSKIEQYNQEKGDDQLVKLKFKEQEVAATGGGVSSDLTAAMLGDKGGAYGGSQKQYEDELEEILEIQKQYEATSQQGMSQSSNGGATKKAEKRVKKVSKVVVPEDDIVDATFNQTLPARFYGAGDSGDNQALDLVPAETVDHGVIVQGSTVAIRTKKSIRIASSGLEIPNGAVLYGKAAFGNSDRLTIDIHSYKAGDKIYPLSFNIYDFDGRQGIHLGNRSWYKIPSKVSKDVFEYAYTRGTNQSAFGGGNDVNLEDAKNIALLSGIKEVGDELFDKRRVLLPRKYHLWIHINTQNL